MWLPPPQFHTPMHRVTEAGDEASLFLKARTEVTVEGRQATQAETLVTVGQHWLLPTACLS